jgi:hypothetical protein
VVAGAVELSVEQATSASASAAVRPLLTCTVGAYVTGAQAGSMRYSVPSP